MNNRLKENYPLYFRIGLLSTIVILILAFRFVPQIKVKPYTPPENPPPFQVIPFTTTPPVTVPPKKHIKLPVAADKNEKVETQTIPTTEFTNLRHDVDVKLKVFEFYAVEVKPKVLNLEEVQKMVGYPDIARKAGIEGQVILKVLVWTDGTVKKVSVAQSDYDAFNDPAVKSAYHLRFSPAKQRDKPVPVWVYVPFKFSLTDE